MQLARWIPFLLIFPSAAFTQSSFSCPANQYVATQLVNTGQTCAGLPALLSQNTTGTAANVTGVVAPANGGRIINTETAGAGGVTINTFVATDTSAPTKFVTAPSGSCGSGVALATAASGSTFPLSGYDGTMQVVADSGGVTAGHLIVGSTVTPGDAMDSGQTSSLLISEKTTVCGTALNTVAAGGLVTINPRSRGSFGHLIDNIGGTLLSPLGTGILKLTGGVPSLAAAGTDYQAPVTLTTTGTSGAATLTGGTLNIPQYSGGGGSTAFQQNGTALISSTTVNYQTGAGNGGVVVTNPSAGNVAFNLSLPIAGAGAGFTTGPTSSLNSRMVCFSGTAGQIADCATLSPLTTTIVLTGSLSSKEMIFTGTAFTIGSGCGTTSSLTGGAMGGSFVAGQTACAPVIATGVTAPHGFACWANDLTTPADTIHQIATSTTTATLSGTVAASDVINWGCIAY